MVDNSDNVSKKCSKSDIYCIGTVHKYYANKLRMDI